MNDFAKDLLAWTFLGCILGGLFCVMGAVFKGRDARLSIKNKSIDCFTSLDSVYKCGEHHCINYEDLPKLFKNCELR